MSHHGAVSEEVVVEMATGALNRIPSAHVAIAVSGIAGPAGDEINKPVGTVWIAWHQRGSAYITRCFHFKGDREAIRYQAAQQALAGLLDYLV